MKPGAPFCSLSFYFSVALCLFSVSLSATESDSAAAGDKQLGTEEDDSGRGERPNEEGADSSA